LTCVTHLRSQVVPVQIDQLLARQKAQPEEKRHGGLLGVIRQAFGIIEKSLLEHVGGINASLEPAVQPQPHNLPQARAMTREQLSQRLGIAGLHLRQQIMSRRRVIFHGT
jgi:hypothetical protein